MYVKYIISEVGIFYFHTLFNAWSQQLHTFWEQHGDPTFYYRTTANFGPFETKR